MTATTAARRGAAPRRLDDPASYRLEEQIGFVLRRAHQKATSIFNGVMSEFGVTPTQFAALAKLDDAGRGEGEPHRLAALVLLRLKRDHGPELHCPSCGVC